MSFLSQFLSGLMTATALLFPAVPHQNPTPAAHPPPTVAAPALLAASITATTRAALPAPHLFPSAGASSKPSNGTYAGGSAGVVLGTSTQVSYVTQDELTAQLTEAANALRSLIYQNNSAPGSPYATGGYTNEIALSNDIDNLSGSSNGPLTISDATLNNVSGLTASEIPPLSSLTGLLGLGQGGTGATSTSTARVSLGVDYATTTDTDATYNIACWGDSHTQGAGGSTPYPTYLSQILGNRPVFNGGIGGQTSTQIAARMLAAPAKFQWTVVIWAGANNWQDPTQVESDIASMVAAVGTNNHYLILSIMNAEGEGIGTTAYTTKLQINSYLASTYPNNYFDIREYLIQHGLSAAGLTPTSQDITDISNDIVPTSLRVDTTHLNSIGNQLVAQQVANFIQKLDATNQQAVLTPNALPAIFAAPFSIGTVYQPVGFFSSMAIGTSSTSTPPSTLYVYGPINTDPTIGGYEIGGTTVLQASSSLESLFVGASGDASTTGLDNNVLGQAAFTSDTTGGDNEVIGKQALTENTSGSDNVAIGSYSLADQTTGYDNIAVGDVVLQNNLTGWGNVGIGYFALNDATSTNGETAFGTNALQQDAVAGFGDNTAIGFHALANNTFGTGNTAVGSEALPTNTTGSGNIGLGYDVLGSNTTGSNNIGLGNNYTLQNNSTGSYNVAIGSSALRQNTTGQFNIAVGASDNSVGGPLNSNTVGSNNLVFGYRSLANSTTGSNNAILGSLTATNNLSATNTVAIGYRAAFGGGGNGTLYANQGGTVAGYEAGMNFQTGSDYNTLFGYQAGYDITSGSNNLILGTEQTTGFGITTGSNNILLGNGVNAGLSQTASNQLNIGNLIFGSGLSSNATLSTGYIGIGTTTPATTLSISGNDYITGGEGVGLVNTTAGTLQTKGSAIFGGTVGIGTTSPSAEFTIQASNANPNPDLFIIASSTPNSTTTLFTVDNEGDLSAAGGLTISGTATSTFANGLNLTGGCVAIQGSCITAGGGSGAVLSVSNSDGTLTISPTTGAVLSSLNLGHGNTWTALQQFSNASTTLFSAYGPAYFGATATSSFASDGTLTLSKTFSANGTTGTSTAGTGQGLNWGNNYLVVQGATGNVGIGTVNPTYPLQVQGSNGVVFNADSNTQHPAIILSPTPGNADVYLNRDGTGNGSAIYFETIGAFSWSNPQTANFTIGTNSSSLGYFGIWTNGNTGTSPSVVVSSSGNLGIGTTTPYSRLTVWGPDTSGGTAPLTISNSASTTELQVFDNGNATLAGTLTQNSDQRLKTNIQSLEASSSLSLIDELNPVTFNWIDPSEGTTPQLGFIAQQVEQIFPNLISTTSPTALTPGGTLGLNYIGLISPIVSAIQALSGEVQNVIAEVQGFAQSFTTQVLTAGTGNFSNELCVGSTCVTPAQFQAMVAAYEATSNQSQSSAQQSPAASSSLPGSVTQNSAFTTATIPPTITINGDNPAIITVGDSYADLGATVTDTGPGQAGDTNLGLQTFLNGVAVQSMTIDTSQVATDTIDYVATDTAGLTATSTRTVLIEGATAATSTTQ